MDGAIIVSTKPSDLNVSQHLKNAPPSEVAVTATIEVAQPSPDVSARGDAETAQAQPIDADPAADSWKGWLVVACSFLVNVWSVGLTYSFGVFVLPLQAQFGVHRSPIIWAISLMRFVMLLSGVGTGYLADRWSYRGTALIGALLLTAGLELSSIVNNLWQQFLTFALIGLGGGFCFIPAVAVISEWFQKRRGLANGLAMAGTGMGTVLLPLMTQPLIDHYGWRWAMRSLGFGALIFLVPCALCIRRRVTVNPRRRYRFVGRDMVFTRTFLFLGISIFFYAMAFQIPIVNCVANAVDKGIKLPQVLLAAIGASSVAGRIVLGLLSDWVGKTNVLKLSILTMAMSIPFWPFVVNFWQNLIFAIVYGFAAGSFNGLLAATAGDYFGTNSIAGVSGMIYALCAFGNLIGPPMSARMYDQYGNYFAAAMFATGCAAVGFLALWGLEPAEAAYAKYRAEQREKERRAATFTTVNAANAAAAYKLTPELMAYFRESGAFEEHEVRRAIAEAAAREALDEEVASM